MRNFTRLSLTRTQPSRTSLLRPSCRANMNARAGCLCSGLHCVFNEQSGPLERFNFASFFSSVAFSFSQGERKEHKARAAVELKSKIWEDVEKFCTLNVTVYDGSSNLLLVYRSLVEIGKVVVQALLDRPSQKQRQCSALQSRKTRFGGGVQRRIQHLFSSSYLMGATYVFMVTPRHIRVLPSLPTFNEGGSGVARENLFMNHEKNFPVWPGKKCHILPSPTDDPIKPQSLPHFSDVRSYFLLLPQNDILRERTR